MVCARAPWLAVLVLVCSCSLLVDTGVGGGDAGSRDDAVPDGGTPLPGDCSMRGFLHLAMAGFPASRGRVALADGGGVDYVLDTGAARLVGPAITVDGMSVDQIEGIALVTIDGVTVAFLSVDSLTSSPEALLRAVGPHPLVIGSLTTIALEGALLANSSIDGALGAGANPAVCTEMPGFGKGTDGETSAMIEASGGGGGGFATRGGDGGASLGVATSMGGLPIVGSMPALHGGCPGGTGGALATGTEGAGGAGGGAVYLAACTSISLAGGVNVGGAGGGAGGTVTGAGGGGGGSGGYLAIDAPSVVITADVAANGGGGGSSIGGGLDGGLGDEPASGGEGALSGGDGATGSDEAGNGEPGTAPGDGAGGGGGGRGQIVIRALAPLPDSSRFSPDPVIIDE